MNNVIHYKKVTTVNKNGIEFELCAYNFVEPENYLWNSNSCSKRYKPSKLSIFSTVKVNQKKSNISKIFLQDYTITAMLSLVDKIHVTEPNSNTKFYTLIPLQSSRGSICMSSNRWAIKTISLIPCIYGLRNHKQGRIRQDGVSNF